MYVSLSMTKIVQNQHRLLMLWDFFFFKQHIFWWFSHLFAADRYFVGPLDDWSTLHRQITYHLTANDCVQSPAMESNHDTNYQSAANVNRIYIPGRRWDPFQFIEFRFKFHWNLIVPRSPNDNKAPLVQIMAWRQTGDKPLFTWTNADPGRQWHIFAALGEDEYLQSW